ncbi:MAG: biopolymer transporter ExbD [Verrucomicrobiota bacterium]
MKFRRTLAEPEEPIELNLIPLIDVIMFLLIFFISTTTFVEDMGVEVDKPQAAAPQQVEDNSSILIAITASGQVVHDGREVGIGGVRQVVMRLNGKDGTPVIIQADTEVPAGTLVRVIDEAKLGGAKNVSLASTRKS